MAIVKIKLANIVDSLYSAYHCRCLSFHLVDGLLVVDLLSDAPLHLLPTFVVSDHHVVLSNFLLHLASLHISDLLLVCLPHKDVVANLGMHLVTLGLLLVLLRLQSLQEITFLLILRLERFLFYLGTEKGGTTVLMDLL